MPGLPYKSLPAERQTPGRILQERYGRFEQHLRSQSNREIGNLKNQRLPAAQAQQQLNKIVKKYRGVVDQERYKLGQQTQQLEHIQSLVSAGNITQEAGNRAAWNMVMPREVAEAIQPERQTSGTPFAVGSLQSTAMLGSIKSHADAAPDIRGLEWGRPRKKKEDLVIQYQRWRDYVGYESLNPTKQNQLDIQWDAYMRGNEAYEQWWSDKKDKRTPAVEIQALRPGGRIAGAMRKRISGTPIVPGISPIGRALIAKPTTQSVAPAASADTQKLAELKRRGWTDAEINNTLRGEYAVTR